LRSPEEKLRIVLAVLRGELSLTQAAREARVAESTIGRWRDQFLDGGLGALSPKDQAPAVEAAPPDEPRAEPAEVEPMGAPEATRGEGGAARYIDAVRAHWLLVVAIVVVAVGFAAAYSVVAPKRYEAGADILVTPISATDDSLLGLDVLQDSSDSSSSVLTEARLAKSPQVADAVRAKLHLTMSSRALLDAVSVEPVSQANVLAIVASASTAAEAARIANGFATEVITEHSTQFQSQLVRRLDRLQGVLQGIRGEPGSSDESAAIQGEIATLSPLVGEPDPTLHLAGRATPPYSPASPRPALTILIAFFASLLLGLGVALGLETFSPRVNREDELLFGHRLPVLARVPGISRQAAHDYLAGRAPLPEEAWEAYRMLRANLATAGSARGFPRTILMTSAIRGEGRTMSTLNLAVTVATAGARVIAVDADLRRPMLATVFGVATRGNGFADVFVNNGSVERALVPAPGHGDRLRLVLASQEEADLVDALEPERVRRGLGRLAREADVIIIDSPAVTEAAYALTFAAAVDAVLVVTLLGHSRPDELSQLRRMLAFRRITPTGFIVTMRRPAHADALRRLRGWLRPQTSGGPVPEPAQGRALGADAEHGPA
jgi:polysaccharide biosynthesis transport protein